MRDGKTMLLGLSDGCLYSISWKGEVMCSSACFLGVSHCIFFLTFYFFLYIFC